MDKKLTDYEKLFLLNLMGKNSNRFSKLQLVKHGVPFAMITKLIKLGILCESCVGSLKYYGVSEDIFA